MESLSTAQSIERIATSIYHVPSRFVILWCFSFSSIFFVLWTFPRYFLFSRTLISFLFYFSKVFSTKFFPLLLCFFFSLSFIVVLSFFLYFPFYIISLSLYSKLPLALPLPHSSLPAQNHPLIPNLRDQLLNVNPLVTAWLIYVRGVHSSLLWVFFSFPLPHILSPKSLQLFFIGPPP